MHEDVTLRLAPSLEREFFQGNSSVSMTTYPSPKPTFNETFTADIRQMPSVFQIANYNVNPAMYIEYSLKSECAIPIEVFLVVVQTNYQVRCHTYTLSH
jgi:hypothetical protein